MKQFPAIEMLHHLTLTPTGVPFDERQWPDEWKQVEFKEYPRFPQTLLPLHSELAVDFKAVLQGRKSTRAFNSKTLDTQTLSDLLFWSAGINRSTDQSHYSKRFYPSGGGLYPLEVYCSFIGNEDIKEGLYHYNVKKHSLEHIGNTESSHEIRNMPNYRWTKDAPLLIFISAVFDRTMRKYGERGYRFVHVETGALVQTFYLVAQALELGLCGLGTVVESRASELLELQNSNEPILLHLAVGYPEL